MRRRLITGSVIVLLVVGLWQFGQGIWVYAKATLAQHLLQRAWLRTVDGEVRVIPWPWADTWPVARLQAPVQSIDLIVLAGANGRTLAFGPGLASESAGPGTTGPAVISAHRDTHFRFLKHVKLGDELLLEWPRKTPQRYQITETQIVDSRTTTIVNDGGQESLVLITCYPFDAITPGGPLRYIVLAEKFQNP